MSYSALYFKKNKRSLYIMGMASILFLVIGAVFFIKQWGIQNGWKKTTGIDRLFVVNRSPHGFEVIWSTKNPVKEAQWVEVGSNKNLFEIKSKEEKSGGVYRAIVSGLRADTTYYFRVRVGTQTYILPSLVQEIVHTPKEVKEKPISPAYGKVVLPSTRPYANGLLIYEIDGYHPFAVFTKETGEWLLPLTGLIEKKSNSITSVADSSLVSIKLFSYPEGTIRTTVGQTRPLRNAIVAGTSVRLAQSIRADEETVLGTSSQNLSQLEKNSSSIIYPKENALIPGNAPLIRGTAPVGKDVTVLIQASTKQYSYRAKTNEKGDWVVQYPLNLEPGKYIVVATIENSNGVPTILRRTFDIIKSGEQVLGVATDTPTLVPTSAMPTNIPTLVPTLVPTGELIATQMPTVTLNPTAVLPTRLVPTTTPPVSGGGMSAFLFGALFCIVVGAGLVLAF